MQKYKVSNIVKTTKLTPQGEIIPIYEVSFETEKGIRDEIEVNAEVFSKDVVQEMIEERVRTITEIMELE